MKKKCFEKLTHPRTGIYIYIQKGIWDTIILGDSQQIWKTYLSNQSFHDPPYYTRNWATNLHTLRKYHEHLKKKLCNKKKQIQTEIALDMYLKRFFFSFSIFNEILKQQSVVPHNQKVTKIFWISYLHRPSN